MPRYETPEEFRYRIHHVRPRFKNNVERVLLFVATELSQLTPMTKKDFDKKFNRALRLFPGNAVAAEKTISNWRTEISSLFGMILHDPATEMCMPSDVAKRLAEKQDLVEFFKYFLYTFQYPGGHIKPHEVKKIIDKGIKFKPAQYILNLLDTAEKIKKRRFGISKAEATHCIFNDLRVTRDGCSASEVIKLLDNNRKSGLDYDWSGDIIRYAGDILDYMVYANLLKKNGEFYYLNLSEKEAILFFIKKSVWFNRYDRLYGTSFELSKLQEIGFTWLYYVSSFIGKIRFETDVLSYLNVDKAKYLRLESIAHKQLISEFMQRAARKQGVKTKDIGDTGEALVQGHECMILKKRSREDLIPKVVILPNHLAMGYDIRSFEPDDTFKFIEVKTTISNSSLDFNRFHLTDNEFNAAKSYDEKYYVYRLMITRAGIKLFVIRNPIKMYKKDLIEVTLGEGAEMQFKTNAGKFEELLIWGA
ncbi:protein NO VEIN domain-containing protein [Candidatus Nitrosotenuis uzonensis]|uniref:Protein NO VEIN C-terminal domain-containing protein n=1 Tax=Candidatus Nitrosotenuis uzonensis TaxID=1407055 RepID=A0A812EYW7_9ARCH|nr:DUF3883 domain-containing protein [Candidatus Nitrosotenuis uzonensis]CAE6485817.1 conserved hypothetical protein [Candidatus Nitrosotenuis uzonensis]